MQKLILAAAIVASLGFGLLGAASAQSTQGQQAGKYVLRFPVYGLKAAKRPASCPAGQLTLSQVMGPDGDGYTVLLGYTAVVPRGCTTLTFDMRRGADPDPYPTPTSMVDVGAEIKGMYRLRNASGGQTVFYATYYSEVAQLAVDGTPIAEVAPLRGYPESHVENGAVLTTLVPGFTSGEPGPYVASIMRVSVK